MTDYTLLPKNQKIMTLAGTLLGMLLAALDQTIVATAGPSIQKDLHIDPSLYVWLTTSYLVASTVMTPMWGKLSDIFGRRTVLVTGISIFLLGSLFCGISQSTTQLILARVVQGIGSASLFTTAFAVVADLFTPRERGKYAGIFGAVFGLSSVIGPLVGGFITDNFGWHWCFFINLPIGAVALGVILTRMPALTQEHQAKPTIDYLGAALFAVAIIPLLLALSFGKTRVEPGVPGFLWQSSEIVGMFAAFVVFLTTFILWELRARDPMIDMRMFKNRPYAIGNAASFTVGMAFLGAIVFLPLFMVNVVGSSATWAGLATVPLTFGIVAGNIISGQVSSRTGRYKFLIVGALVVLMAGFAVMAFTVHSDSTQLGMAGRMVLIGLGLGPSIPLFNLHISNSVEPHQIGAATSTATLARSLGSTMGLAIFGTVFGTTLTGAMEQRMAEATAGVPPAMVAQMRSSSSSSTESASAEEGGRAGTVFDQHAVEANVKRRFSDQRSAIDLALGKDDPVALAALKNNPNLDERLKAIVDGGGITASITAAFAASQQKVAAGVEQGPDAVAGLQSDPTLPPPLKASLAQIPPEALASPEGRAQVLATLAHDMAPARDAAITTARAQAIAGAHQGLDAAEQTALSTVAKVGAALKEAFTDAITRVYLFGIFFALLGLLVSLAIPELPLRGVGPGGAPPPVE